MGKARTRKVPTVARPSPRAPPRPLVSYWPWLVLAVIVGVGLSLRNFHTGFPVIGYHNWKETHYLTEARNFAREGLFAHGFLVPAVDYTSPEYDPTGAHSDTFPTISLIVGALFALFGPHLALARWTSILFSLGSIVVMYFLVRRLFKREDLALVAAALTAISPLFVFFSHNTDVVNPGLFLSLLGLHYLVGWYASERPRDLFLGTLFFGFGALTKYPFAALAVPLLFTLPYRRFLDRAFLRRARTALIGCALVAAFVVFWVVYMGGPVSARTGSKTVTPGILSPEYTMTAEWAGRMKPYIADNYTTRGFVLAILGGVAALVFWRKSTVQDAATNLLLFGGPLLVLLPRGKTAVVVALLAAGGLLYLSQRYRGPADLWLAALVAATILAFALRAAAPPQWLMAGLSLLGALLVYLRYNDLVEGLAALTIYFPLVFFLYLSGFALLAALAAWLALAGGALAYLTRATSLGHRFLYFGILGTLAFAVVMVNKLKGHSYHQYPVAPFVILCLAYLFIALSWRLANLLRLLTVRRPALLVGAAHVLLLLLVLWTLWGPSLAARARQFDTLFPGLDVAGEFLDSHAAPQDRVMHSSEQSVGVLWHANRKGYSPARNVSDLMRLETEFGVKWLFVYRWEIPTYLRQGDTPTELQRYVEDNYRLRQFGFSTVGENLMPVYFVFERGGTFDPQNLGSQLRSLLPQSRAYSTLSRGEETLSYVTI